MNSHISRKLKNRCFCWFPAAIFQFVPLTKRDTNIASNADVRHVFLPHLVGQERVTNACVGGLHQHGTWQPRSQGSLLPALRSERETIINNQGN